jgi:elongator complex protein 4
LVQQYYVAEGLACGHHVCVIDSEADDFMKDLLWYPKSALQDKGLSGQVPSGGDGDPEDEDQVQTDTKVKIAWRYEQMKQFQTTVSSPISYVFSSISSLSLRTTSRDALISTSRSIANHRYFQRSLRSHRNSENYCHVFDLTSRIPQSVLDEAVGSTKMSLIPPNSPAESSEDIPTVSALRHIEKTLQKQIILPVRVCIPSLGSPSGWGDITAQVSRPRPLIHTKWNPKVTA